MNKINFILTAAISGVLTLSSCSDSNSESNRYEPIILTEQSRATASSLESFYLEFAKDAFRFKDSELKDGEPRQNVVVSPYSASVALGMLANGVDETTREKIMGYLGVDNIDEGNEMNKALLASLPAVDRKSDVRIANAIWPAIRFTLNQDFTTVMDDFYGASVSYLDFSDSENATRTINNWISTATNQKIINYLKERIDPQTAFVLANAIYFQSQWAEDFFDKRKTVPGEFHSLDKDEPDMVPIMHSNKIKEAITAEDEHFQYAAIPFGNTAYYLRIILPKENISFDDAMDLLDFDRYNTLRKSAGYPNKFHIDIPRFEISSRVDLTEMLESRGIDLAVDTEMFTSDIKDVCLKASQGAEVTINEEGGEAAAVTVVGGLTADLTPPLSITADRPFLFFIVEKGTNACLIAGRVAGFGQS